MSFNNSLNAVIALIEDAPALAREYFRSPNSDVKNVGEATARLYRSLDRRFAKVIRKILVECLTITVPDNGLVETREEDFEQGFYAGVRATEQVFEKYLEHLER